MLSKIYCSIFYYYCYYYYYYYCRCPNYYNNIIIIIIIIIIPDSIRQLRLLRVSRPTDDEVTWRRRTPRYFRSALPVDRLRRFQSLRLQVRFQGWRHPSTTTTTPAAASSPSSSSFSSSAATGPRRGFPSNWRPSGPSLQSSSPVSRMRSLPISSKTSSSASSSPSTTTTTATQPAFFPTATTHANLDEAERSVSSNHGHFFSGCTPKEPLRGHLLPTHGQHFKIRTGWASCVVLNYTTQHHNTSHYITSHHITLRNITSHYTTSHYITSHHITQHHITSHHITSHHITQHHITLHHITLHYITLHHIISHHITQHDMTWHDMTLQVTITTLSRKTTMRFLWMPRRCHGDHNDLEWLGIILMY